MTRRKQSDHAVLRSLLGAATVAEIGRLIRESDARKIAAERKREKRLRGKVRNGVPRT